MPESKPDSTILAPGTRLAKRPSSDRVRGQRIDYINNFVYKNGNLSYVITQEGKISFPPQDDPLYQYFIQDHLGNTRAVVDEEGHHVQQSSYYPFGLQADALTWSSDMHPENEYLYNGKELQDDFGLDWYDYGARMYDAQLGRWHVGDPMAENAYGWSPFRYGFNNPIRYSDIDGKFELDNAQKYPRLAAYLKNQLYKILGNNTIMSNLHIYGEMTYNKIAKDVEWGKGPEIVVVDNLKCAGKSSNGCFNENTPNKLFIDKNIIEYLESASLKDIDAALLRVISTILHEYVHHGDYLFDKQKKEYEAGNAFEIYTYGMNISSLSDAKKVLSKYKERRKNDEKKEKEKEDKKKKLHQLFNNFDKLKQGKYKWDGDNWRLNN